MLREIDKHLLKQVAILKKAQEEGRQVYFLKNRRCGHTMMIQLLETEDIEHEEIIKKELMSDNTWMDFEEYEFERAYLEGRHMEWVRANPDTKDKINKVILSKVKGFKEWVEQTSLFNAIKNNPHATEIRANDGSIKIVPSGIKINTAEELPTEFLLEFYMNSPFNTTTDNNTKQIENNDNTDIETLW